MGASTVGITAMTAWRVSGPVAAWTSGTILAVYGPHVLASGTLTAEAVLIAIQTVAVWCIVEAIGRTNSRVTQTAMWGVVGGLFLGVTILRPALQFTAVILLGATLAGALKAGAKHQRLEARYNRTLAAYDTTAAFPYASVMRDVDRVINGSPMYMEVEPAKVRALLASLSPPPLSVRLWEARREREATYRLTGGVRTDYDDAADVLYVKRDGAHIRQTDVAHDDHCALLLNRSSLRTA